MASLHLANEIFKLIYPVGSIYLSDNATNPSSKFGGTWVQLKDHFLYAGSSFSSGNGTGTATNSHTLTIDQIPSHNHKLKMRNAGKWSWNDGSASGDMMEGGYYWDANNTTFNWLIEDQPQGGGKGHSHNIPYQSIYVWRRTA